MAISDLLHLIAVHSDETRHLDLLSCPHIDDVVTTFERALVDTNVGELTKPTSLVRSSEREREFLHDREKDLKHTSSLNASPTNGFDPSRRGLMAIFSPPLHNDYHSYLIQKSSFH